MKRSLIAVGLMAAVLFGAQTLNSGKSALLTPSLIQFTCDTVVSAETSWTAAYQIASTKGMTGYIALHVKADSVHDDSIKLEIVLQESFDGVYWLWTTRLGALHADRSGAAFDSTYEVNLYPLPFNRWGVLNYAGSNDTFLIKALDIFNPVE